MTTYEAIRVTGSDYLKSYFTDLRAHEADAASKGTLVMLGDGFFGATDGRRELRSILEKGEFEGVTFTVLEREVKDGDTYLACRNGSPQLLTAEKVVPYPDEENGLEYGGFVAAKEPAYAFDLGECIVVELAL